VARYQHQPVHPDVMYTGLHTRQGATPTPYRPAGNRTVCVFCSVLFGQLCRFAGRGYSGAVCIVSVTLVMCHSHATTSCGALTVRLAGGIDSFSDIYVVMYVLGIIHVVVVCFGHFQILFVVISYACRVCFCHVCMSLR
jgi:hypothetical protein